MSNKVVLLIAIGLGIFLGSNLFKRTVTVTPPPRIITQTDTVRQIDTLWRVKAKATFVHDTVNVVERVTVTVPETVTVLPQLVGLTSLRVGASPQDSTMAAGFTLQVDTSRQVTRRAWIGQYYTSGPLQALFVDSVPPQLHFGTFPPPPRCTITNGGVSYAGKGVAVVELLRIILGHP